MAHETTSDAPCEHKTYNQDVKVSIIDLKVVAIRQLTVRIKLTCSQCNQPFLFEGQPGFSTERPMTSPDMTELRAPIQWPLRVEDEKKDDTLQ